MKSKVSVLLPVYNGAHWLEESISSVLDQSMRDFELIIIDDGSKDDSWKLITKFNDSRIRAYSQNNIGLAATLNRGVQLATSPFVARLDQDDWMCPSRLDIQMQYMNANQQCAAVGSWAKIMSNDILTDRFHKHPLENASIKLMLLFDNPFVHSSMLLRRAAILKVGGYCEDTQRQPPEDYELWSRLAREFSVANIGSAQVVYREVAESMSRIGPSPFKSAVVNISTENIFYTLKTKYSLDECNILASIFHGANTSQTLSYKKIRSMILDAATAIGGPKTSWTEEYSAVFTNIFYKIISLKYFGFLPRNYLKNIRSLINAAI